MNNKLCISLLGILLMVLTACQPAAPKTEPAIKTEAPASTVPTVDTSRFETFTMQDGDTTFLMKKYFLCFLKTGPNRSQGEAEATRLQAEHLANISRLAEEGHICMAGPFEDDSDIQGILVFSVPSLEEAERLAATDPAVQAGRLTVEIHPWWAAVGSRLF